MHVFTALAVPARLTIIEMLAQHGRMSATEIAQGFRMSAPAISQHLRVLLDANLVLVQKEGRHRFYEINPSAIDGIQQWATHVQSLWEERLDSLDQFLKNNSQ